MQSPFKVLRRYQKVMLAAMALVAMISFGVGDIITRMTRSSSSVRADIVVETNVDNLTQDAVRKLIQRRYLANAFMFKALLASNPEYEKFAQFMPSLARRFGGQTPREVVNAWLMQHEAHRLGIVVDDKQIEDFIRLETNRKLSTEQFSKVLDGMQIKPLEIYDILRDELLAQTAFKMLAPVSASSPEQYWKFYQQLHTRQKIEVAALPIKDFAANVEPPSEALLEKFFNTYKTRFESSASGEYRPGLRQPPKVDLHSLQFTYLGIEEMVLKDSPVTDKEIEAYYEEKKGIDRRFQDVSVTPPADETPHKETAPIDPELAPEKRDRPEPPAGPSDDADKNSPPKETPCGADDAKSDEAPAADATEEKSPATPTEKVDEPAGTEEKAKEVDGTPLTEESASPDAEAKSQKPLVRQLKFKPLDDELRAVVRESIVHERTLARMKEVASKAAEALRDVGLQFAQGNEFDFTRGRPEDIVRLADRSRKELQALAEKFGAKFADTGLVNARELSELPGIGKAQEPDSNEFTPGGVKTVVDMAFETETLCRVMEAESAPSGGSRDMFVFWKVQHVPAHVPAFNEPGVREQAIEAWKLQQALPEAKKRAEQLADLVRNAKEPLSAVLAGQTITGSAKALGVTVQESPEFSWFRESSAPDPSMRQPPLRLSDPIVVTNAGMKFMEYVFDTLGDGDVGVTLNDDASMYYVVKVTSRRAADREGFKSAPLFSGSSPYSRLAQMERQMAASEFIQQLEKSYAVRWHDADAEAMAATDFDE